MSKLDKIDLKIWFEEDKTYNTGWFVKQEIYVNDKLFQGYCEILTFFQVQTWISPYDGKTSWSYLDSCSCGCAGCAGIWEGVHIRKKKGIYYYSARKRGGYREGILGSGKLNLRVSQKNVEEIREHIVEVFKDNTHKPLCQEDKHLEDFFAEHYNIVYEHRGDA